MERPKAYSYLRFSTPNQSKGDSYRRQAEKAVEYAAKHDLDLQEDYRLDLGVSAYKGTNLREGALGVFVKECLSGVIPKGSYLLIESLDRLSREDAHDALRPWLDIQSAGVKIVTLADNKVYDRSNQADIYYAIAVMQRAHDESRTKGDRIANAWAKKRSDVLAKDHKISIHCPGWLRLSEDRKEFLEIPERVAIVKRLFLSAANGKGAKLLAKELNLEKVPTFNRGEHWRTVPKEQPDGTKKARGIEWSEAYINKILKSRSVLGEIQLHKIVDGKRVPEGDPIPGYFPAVISVDLFNEVAVGRRERAIGGGGRRGEGQSNIFTRIAYCGYCGGKMRFKDKGKGHVYLVCNGRFNGSGCDCKPWVYSDFERSFLTFVRAIDLRGLADGAKAQNEAKTLSDGIVSAQENVRLNKTRITDYLIRVEEDADLADVYNDRIRQLSAKTKELTSEIADMQSKLDNLTDSIDTISEAELTELVSTFQNPTGENRYKLTERIRQLVDRIDIFPTGPRLDGIDQAKEPKDSMFAPRPQFRVHFKSGTFQMVTLDTDNPEAIHTGLIYEDGNVSFQDRDNEA